MAAATGNAERAAKYVAVAASKYVPVESVDEVYFEGQGMRFKEGRALDDRKILVDVPGVPDTAHGYRQISEDVSALGNQAVCIRLEKRGAVEKIIGAVRAPCAVSVLCAATVGAIEDLKGRCVLTDQRHSGDLAESEVASGEVRRIREFIYDHRRPALVTVHAADLPSTQDFAGRSVAQILLPGARRKFIKIAEHEFVRDVLITHTLFALQIVWVLRAEDV